MASSRLEGERSRHPAMELTGIWHFHKGAGAWVVLTILTSKLISDDLDLIHWHGKG